MADIKYQIKQLTTGENVQCIYEDKTNTLKQKLLTNGKTAIIKKFVDANGNYYEIT